jgi:hypothetical protein
MSTKAEGKSDESISLLFEKKLLNDQDLVPRLVASQPQTSQQSVGAQPVYPGNLHARRPEPFRTTIESGTAPSGTTPARGAAVGFCRCRSHRNRRLRRTNPI